MDKARLNYGNVEITFSYNVEGFSFRDFDAYAKQRFGIDQDMVMRYQRNGIGKCVGFFGAHSSTELLYWLYSYYLYMNSVSVRISYHVVYILKN